MGMHAAKEYRYTYMSHLKYLHYEHSEDPVLPVSKAQVQKDCRT